MPTSEAMTIERSFKSNSSRETEVHLTIDGEGESILSTPVPVLLLRISRVDSFHACLGQLF